MPSPSERLFLLAVLDSDEACRLVAVWPNVSKKLRGPAVIAKWADLADVPRWTAGRLAEVLFGNGICRPDRTVDPKADEYVHLRIAGRLKRAGAGRPGKPRAGARE